jgi:hypothetical protein
MCIFSSQDPVWNEENFLGCSYDVLAQDPENICDETVSNPSFLVTIPSRIDKDPELSWSFQVWLRILPVTRGKTFAISEAKMRLSDGFRIFIPGLCHSVTSLIIRIRNKKDTSILMSGRAVPSVSPSVVFSRTEWCSPVTWTIGNDNWLNSELTNKYSRSWIRISNSKQHPRLSDSDPRRIFSGWFVLLRKWASFASSYLSGSIQDSRRKRGRKMSGFLAHFPLHVNPGSVQILANPDLNIGSYGMPNADRSLLASPKPILLFERSFQKCSA